MPDEPEPYPFDNEEQVKQRAQQILSILHDQVVEEIGQPPHSVKDTLNALSRVLCRWGPRESFSICGTLVQHGVDQFKDQ